MDLNNIDNESENLKNSRRNLFDYQKYVKYSPTKNTCKCIIRNCRQILKGRVSGNIKRHYESVHHLIIYYRFFARYEIEAEEQQSYILKENLRKYYDYYPLLHKSFCKYLSCEVALDGMDTNKLIRHYKQEHNYDILNEIYNEQQQQQQINENFLSLKYIEDYDKINKTYKCLFKNCYATEVENVEDIRKHYLDKHNIIATDTALMKKLYKHTGIDDDQEDNLEDKGELQQQQQQREDESSDSETELNEAETNDKTTDLIMPIKRTPTSSSSSSSRRTVHIPRFRFNDYVETFPEEKISKCLIESCHRTLSGINANNIKRHYYSIHSMYILHGRRNIRTLEECEQLLKSKYNDSFYYPLNYFVTKEEKSDLYKCIFKTCKHFMPKKITSIKSHYQFQHNILVVKTTDLKIKRKTIDYDSLHKELYINHYKKKYGSNNDNDHLEEDDDKPHTSSQQNKLKRKPYMMIIPENYVIYDKDKNISQCLIKCCNTLLTNNTDDSIKRHFLDMHHFKTFHPNCKPSYEDIEKDLSYLRYDEFLMQSQCLFINCNEILPENWDIIQRHYYEKHNIVIETNQLNKKAFYSIKQDFYDENSCSLYNECDNEDEEFQEESYNHHLENDLNETQQSFNIKTENYNDEYENNEYTAMTMDSYTINEISSQEHINAQEILKQQQYKFLKLCFGLLMKYDLPLEIFDDSKLFKPLLAPYEEKIESDINSKKMEDLMIKVNNIIIKDLKESFNNKVISLELYALSCEEKNYLVLNIRFLIEETVQNRIIGYLPITETTTTLPISEYLNKFGINEEQIYMKTIFPTFEENEHILKICDNIRKHNPDLNNHPIHELQILLKLFIQYYAQDIQNWQTLSNYNNKFNRYTINNLKDFGKYIKNLTETNSELLDKQQNVIQFFKSLQIFWNFFDKLSAEQYVAGDFYRDLLYCELELHKEATKNDNKYALKLNEKLLANKKSLLETNEFLATLYLDVRFNFFNTRLLNEDCKAKAELFLTGIYEKFGNFMVSTNSKEDPLLNANTDNPEDDEYALLDQHFNVNTNVSIQDKLTLWIPAKREPFSLDILNYWRNNRTNFNDIYELIKIIFTFSGSYYILNYVESNCKNCFNNIGNFNKFIIKLNEKVLEGRDDVIFNDF